MNISLSAAAGKQNQKKASLSFGLNNLTTNQKSNVFGGDDEDEDSTNDDRINNTKKSGRDLVNRELLREQEAIRQRASSVLHGSYNFDETYEETNHQLRAAPSAEGSHDVKKESRYIAAMMKNAVKRNHERDVAFERKVAKEQAAEESNFVGKEKFITSAYKKKLAERELWKQEEEEQNQRDEQEDIRKRNDGMAAFYMNFNKNESVGGKEDTHHQGATRDRQDFANESPNELKTERPESSSSLLDGFEASQKATDFNEEENIVVDQVMKEKLRRQQREEKVASARLRYFQRRGITEEEALKEQF